MEDEGGVKAPGTRRRRRLSVEQADDGKVSSAPNTPTKKRGGRKVAKPELDLINENASENKTPKRSTKKSIVKEIEAGDEKSETPSRRSARIKSNTSIVSETTQAVDSPRAKRAARRISQVGSDNETTFTPTRQTRRTRKDSATNIEKTDPQPTNKPASPIIEVISEEPEFSLQKSQSNSEKTVEQNHFTSSVRQSPRRSRKNKSTDWVETNDIENNKEISNSEEHNNSNKENERAQEEKSSKVILENIKENNNSPNTPNEDNNILSKSSSELLNQLNLEPKKDKHILNKSSSSMVSTPNFKNKRQRTKSCTTLSEPLLNDNKYYSDNESAKKKRKSLLNNSNINDLQNISKGDKLNQSLNKKSNQDDFVRAGTDAIESSNLPSSSKKQPCTATVESLFQKKPTNSMLTMVFIDESDSNSEKPNVQKKDDDDQCVPIVESSFVIQDPSTQKDNSFNFSKDNQEKILCSGTENKNDSCEPMDIDETIPDTIQNSLLKALDTSENKDSDGKDKIMDSSTSNESKNRKLSLMLSTSQTLEKKANDNESTLVISQLKDVSNGNHVLQSLQSQCEKNSKSDHALDITQENEIDKKSLSLNYLTSTPLQQKSMIKPTMQVNASGITSNNTSKIDKSHNSKQNKSSNSHRALEGSMSDESSQEDKASNNSHKSLEDSVSNESSQEESKLIDDEAEEASDDYESGDSKDEDQERYERENEIIQKGETLTSEDEVSNDSDYEKDSFVVSSDVEDDELLDGSSDDLSLSDNELKMTAKSKKKYDERVLKEQKKASREMFESRHKLNISNKNIKSESSKVRKKRAVIDSSDSDGDNQVEVKTNKMRLNSDREPSVNKSLSKSNHEDEEEMTICDENAKDDIDPLSVEIKKEQKTPQKDISIKFVDPDQSAEDETKINETQADPLTMMMDDASDSSDSSDNVHIQNYNTILTDLNKNIKTKNIKKGDISLNLDKKTKKSKTAPIVEQLNLTQIKPKKLKTKQSEDIFGTTNKPLKQKTKKSLSKKESNTFSDNNSSDSIDLHLLFSEESNSSENVKSKDDNVECGNIEQDTFIPLKQSQGKINILETPEANDALLSESAKKGNKKRKTLDKSMNEDENYGDSNEVQFFLDTTGTHDSKAGEKSNVSATKKQTEQAIKNDDAPMEVLNKSVLEKQDQLTNCDEETRKLISTPQNKSITKSPKSDKKKRISESIALEQIGLEAKSLNEPITKTPMSEKKKKNRQTKNDSAEQIYEQDSNTIPKITIEDCNIQDNNKEENGIDLADKSINKSVEKTPKSDKKKKKKRLSESLVAEQIPNEVSTELDLQILWNSSKKENSAMIEKEDVADKSINKSVTKTPKSDKKKKKKLSESLLAEQISNEVSTELDVNILWNSAKKQKSAVLEKEDESTMEKKDELGSTKKNKRKSSISTVEDTQATDNVTESTEVVKSKKRKRKSSLNQTDKEQGDEGAETENTLNNLNAISNSRQKKKLKISQLIENTDNNAQDQMTSTSVTAEDQEQYHDIIRTKLKHQLLKQLSIRSDTINTDPKNTRNKKRKERDDDEEVKSAKVSKIDSFDTVHVPRLPTSVLNQLEDKPKKKNQVVTKSKAISTSNFAVEEMKKVKTKPSNYLEESIYLNEHKTTKPNKPKHIRNPKVLPSLPSASTSSFGYTTNFKVNILPKDIQFVAKSTNVTNYKNDYLENKKIKKLGTYELFKRNRNIKMSKF